MKHLLLPLACLWAVLLGGFGSGGCLAQTRLPPAAGAAEQASTAPHNPRSDYWRQVREGVAGYTTVRGPEAEVLIQGSGEVWRQLRGGPLAGGAVWVLGATAAGIFGFYLWRGRLRLERPRSGQRVLRWNLLERILHWYVAVLFLVLAVTGLSLLWGRAALIPRLGHERYAAYAEIAKTLHNFLGLLFMAGLLLMILVWFRDNLFRSIDWDWLRQGGGFSRRLAHPHAGRMNAGEKLWFWLLASAGLLLCLSGLVLDFPNFSQPRWGMQLAHLLHVVSAVLLIAGALGHIYIGTLGTEGAMEGMIRGTVDRTWAEQHHDLWLREKEGDGCGMEEAAGAEHGGDLASKERC